MPQGTFGGLTVCLTLVSLTAMAQDTTPPVLKGPVYDGIGRDYVTQPEDDVIRGSWTPFEERESSLVEYQVAVGTSPECANIEPFRSVGLTSSIGWTLSSGALHQRLSVGTTYFVTVKAINSAGLSTQASSDGVLVTYPDGGVPPGNDGGIPPCPQPDAGVPDAGTVDAGRPDAGTVDAGGPDGDAPPDERVSPLGCSCGTAGGIGGLALLALVMLGLRSGHRAR